MLDQVLNKIRRHIPPKLFNALSPAYHWTLALVAALWYRFPSKEIKVIAVTGTKGKSTTVEILNAILEEAGFKTALTNTIRLKIDHESTPNMYKMSMPGRFFIQRSLRKAVLEGCQYFIMEITSQGVLLSRHSFIDLDALIFTNLSPEHLEAHGSYDNYRAAKLDIVKALSTSSKKNRAIIANTDDPEGKKFLDYRAEAHLGFGLRDIEPYEATDKGITFTFDEKKVQSSLTGLFNLYNILGAATAAKSQKIPDDIIIRAIEKIKEIPGRVERIDVPAKNGGSFAVIVDYAHTPDSLSKLYGIFPLARKVCVLGGTGGGRDTWKRSEMGKIADSQCDEIILTNEDPYDEDPNEIIANVAQGIRRKAPYVIMDRREAIREALKRGKNGDVILITGKGTDPYIMGARGEKVPWSDMGVVKEEVEKLVSGRRMA